LMASARVWSARRAFASEAELADWLGVHRSRVTRWKRGEVPDLATEEQLIGLDVAVSLLTGFLEDDVIPDWLLGTNAHLGHRRPLDVLRDGRLSDVVAAIAAETSGSFA